MIPNRNAILIAACCCIVMLAFVLIPAFLTGSPGGSADPDRADQVTGPVLTEAISSLTLGKATLNLTYSRPG